MFTENWKGSRRVLTATSVTERGTLLCKEVALCCVPDYETRLCHHCLRVDQVKQCQGCKTAWFCSVTCQREAWSLHHQTLCAFMKQMAQISMYARLLVHLWLTRELQLRNELWQQFENLVSIADVSAYIKDTNMAMDLVNLIREKYSNFNPISQNDSSLYFSRVLTNAFEYSEYPISNKQISAQLVLTQMGRFEHHCAPNACLVYQGPSAHLVALRTLQPGDIISISYVDGMLDVHQRRKILYERYKFWCHCRLCQMQLGNDSFALSNESVILLESNALTQISQSWTGKLNQMISLLWSGKELYENISERLDDELHQNLPNDDESEPAPNRELNSIQDCIKSISTILNSYSSSLAPCQWPLSLYTSLSRLIDCLDKQNSELLYSAWCWSAALLFARGYASSHPMLTFACVQCAVHAWQLDIRKQSLKWIEVALLGVNNCWPLQVLNSSYSPEAMEARRIKTELEQLRDQLQ